MGLFAGLLSGGLLSGGDGRYHPDGPSPTGCPPLDGTFPTGSPRAGRPRSAGSAWTSTRCWPASPPSGTASTGPSSATTWPPLGTALADRLFALGWVRRTERRRVVRVTDAGREHLPATLGLDPGWDQPAQLSRPLTA